MLTWIKGKAMAFRCAIDNLYLALIACPAEKIAEQTIFPICSKLSALPKLTESARFAAQISD